MPSRHQKRNGTPPTTSVAPAKKMRMSDARRGRLRQAAALARATIGCLRKAIARRFQALIAITA
jgi:hypothetical protein